MAFSIAEIRMEPTAIYNPHKRKGPKQTVKPSSPEEFKAIIANNTYVLVKFMSPVCPTSKSHMVDFETASHALKEEVPLIKVDVDSFRDVAKEYNITDFPTYRFFVNGNSTDYPGGFQNQTFIDWVRFVTGPDVVDAHIEPPKYSTLYRPTVTVHAKSIPPAFARFASKHRNWALFNFDNTLTGDLPDGNVRLSIIHNSFNQDNDESREKEKSIEFKNESEVIEEKIEEFINKHRFPLVGIMNRITFKDYEQFGEDGVLWVITAPNPKSTIDRFRMTGYHTFGPIAERMLSKNYRLVLTDYKQMEIFLGKHFKTKLEDLPDLIVQPKFSDPSVHWKFQEEFNAGNLERFIDHNQKALDEKRKEKEPMPNLTKEEQEFVKESTEEIRKRINEARKANVGNEPDDLKREEKELERLMKVQEELYKEARKPDEVSDKDEEVLEL